MDVIQTAGLNESDLSHLHQNREKVWAHVQFLLKNSILKSEDVRRTVWSSRRIRPNPESMLVRPYNDSCMLECRLGNYSIKYSIALRYGEVRIGIIIPRKLLGREDLHTQNIVNGTSAYPMEFSNRALPMIISRSIDSSGILVDFIFSNLRFASNELTGKALGGEEAAITMISDAITQELLHISSAVANDLFKQGFVIDNNNIIPIEEASQYEFDSLLILDQLIEMLPLEPSRITFLYSLDTHTGESRYSVHMPSSREEMMEVMEILNSVATPGSIREYTPEPEEE